MRRLPRVRTLLLATYLAVLLLPVGGIAFLRIYESALIRQTEAELLATKNFGQTSLNEIKIKLTEMGLSLRRKAE